MPALPATPKGEATRIAILDRAYAIASASGLEGLSIGALAAAVGMSKSGVFVHFGSREELQLAVLDTAAQRFAQHILPAAMNAQRGLPRLRALARTWFEWIRDQRGSCLLLSAISEYDDRPGPLRDRIVAYQLRWRDELARAISAAVACGELPPDTDTAQLAFEINAVALAVQHEAAVTGVEPAMRQGTRMLDRLLKTAALPQS